MCMESEMILGEDIVSVKLGYDKQIGNYPCKYDFSNEDLSSEDYDDLVSQLRADFNDMTKERLVDSLMMLIERAYEA